MFISARHVQLFEIRKLKPPDDDNYDFYGLPIHGNSGTKIGIDAVLSPSVTPETRTFKPDPNREKVCTNFLSNIAPKVAIQTKTLRSKRVL